MLSIIILFFLTRSIGTLALQKEQKPWKWKLHVIFAWLTGELLGAFIVIHFFGLQMVLLMLFGTAMGYLGYLIVRQNLEKYPEENEN
jgi:hypothetical protein